ncbi:MAG: hypothetical protein J6T57_01435 [Alphaproteobacteria bacterium]|nr:hypothetical protein [Alphaproteobacteria bacterium]
MPTKGNKQRDVKMSLIELQQALQYGLSLEEAKLAKQLDTAPEKIAHAKSTSLYKTIQKKLKERKFVANWSYMMLMALKAKKYSGGPDDKITNPLAISDQCGKPLYTNIEEKRAAFEWAVDYENANAWIGGIPIPLGSPGAELNDVEYTGLWRVQNKEQYNTISIQEKDFVLLDRLNRTEHTNFEYYSAAYVGWTGYGRSCDNEPGYIIGKYETGRGTFYAYGCQWADGPQKALATARAHLAGQVYLTYKDLIIADTIRASKKVVAQSGKTEQKKLFQNKYEVVSVQVQDTLQNSQQAQESDRQFVLLNKLDRTENTNFEYYVAARIDSDGRYSSLDPDYIVAKCKTGRGTFYAYGCQLTDGKTEALATARAHLAVRVYDAYQDMIEAESRRVLDNQK